MVSSILCVKKMVFHKLGNLWVCMINQSLVVLTVVFIAGICSYGEGLDEEEKLQNM